MIEVHSGTWLEIKTWAEAEIGKAAQTLEAGISAEHDHRMRGRLSALRDLLKLADPLPPIGAKSPDYGV